MTPRLLPLCVFALTSLMAVSGWADDGPNDASVRELIQFIFKAEVSEGKHADALSKLKVAEAVCEGDACSPEARADLWLAIGRVQVRLDQNYDAEKSFTRALRAYPGATLPADAKQGSRETFLRVTQRIQKREKQGCRGSYDGARPPRGWRKGEAYHCWRKATQARGRQAWSKCARDARASYDIEQRVQTQAVLARCLDKSKRWGEAIGNYDEIARKGPRRGLYRLSRQTRTRSAQLRRMMPAIVLDVPKKVRDLVVKLDGATLPNEILGQEIALDPGSHLVEARGLSADGVQLSFEQGVSLSPRRTLNILISLAAGPPKWASRSELRCLSTARTADAFSACLGRRIARAGDINTRINFEVSGYHDDMNVDVLTPSVSARVENVTAGWGIGAAFLVDVVTAASTDIVATASPGFREVRWAPALNAHKRFGDFDVGLSGSFSHEPDYLSGSIGARSTLDLRQKTITPSLGYQFSYDVNGRVGTNFEVFSHKIKRHAVDVGVGLVLTKATFGQLAATMVFEKGDSSKPYRHIPIFDPSKVDQPPAGLSIADVNRAREPLRPLEKLPTSRQRYALAMSIAHRFRSSTIRATERIYFDSWGVKASTTDARYMIDVTKPLRLWPHLRLHAQSGASFYKRAYPIAQTIDGTQDLIDTYRAGDRELGPLVAVTLGGGGRYAFGERQNWGVFLTGDGVYTRFQNHLFVTNRWGIFGALGLEVDLE